MIGRQLGHYEIVGKLGAGGMGEVYVANDTRLHREVALKVLPAGLANDPGRLERFEREAKTVAALSHPNIVTIYSVEEIDGIRFMTMERVSGDTLDALIPDSGMAIKRFLEIAVPLADAIAAAHARGVQHRDLKPANVMVDDEGRVKVLDFGLAKQRETAGPEGVTQMLTSELTGEGKIIGTVSYMSPEQAEGRALDHRSDIFSLGILLYEMATGRRPFEGETNLSILSSILKDDPSSVSDVRDAIPIPVARVIQRALAKQPGQRYQSAADLGRDLADVRRDLETGEALSSGLYSGTHAAPGLRRQRPWLRWAGYGAGVAAIAGATALLLPLLTGPPRPPGAPAVTVGNDLRPSVAVFYFDNISKDDELQWLRTGLTDMVVTDLSQTAGVRVLSTDRLYSILQELEQDEAMMTSADVVREVSGRAQTATAIVGSYARAGEELRINLRIQDPRTGEVIASHSVQGAVDAVFDLVDDITDWVERQFQMDEGPAPAPSTEAGVATDTSGGVRTVASDMVDRDLEEVTTDDVAAYRMYSEGVKLSLESKEEMAVPLLEAAVEEDPDFAMAHAKLSVAYGNLGEQNRAEQAARRAFELSDRLPPRERHYIRGRYLSMNPETIGQSIEEYTREVEMFPDHTAARHNLALQLMNLERYGEAIPHLEALRRMGTRFAPSSQQLARAYAVEGDLDAAISVLRDFVDANPDNGAGYANLAAELARAGRYDEALAELDRADAIEPDPGRLGVRWNVYVLAERWDAAEALSERRVAAGGRSEFEARMQQALESLYFGRLTEGRERMLAARETTVEGGPRWMGATMALAEAYQIVGDPAGMLATVQRAREVAYGPNTAQGIEINTAVALALAGNVDRASDAIARFNATLDKLPVRAAVRARVDAQVEGLMAIARGDAAAAARELRTALDANPARDINDDGVQLRFFLGQALWETGRLGEAAEVFAAVDAATLPRVNQPALWLRSLWYLGRYHADRGENAAARDYFERYLRYWGDGEIDRDQVAEARAFLDR